ncbi:GFA family protein [Flavobacterium sp. W21_SRS_FM6]|uniref:GFA family protein n=1 Tax=Flavobacterium sp. W21_SRS_FM6 TaxID=3240268 RepID=UPI003F933DFE
MNLRSKTGCLCGAVNISADNINPSFTVCHCEKCRVWGGGPFFAVKCGKDVAVEGSKHIQEFASSAWATRGFCQQCGTHLYYRFDQTGEYNIPLGLFTGLDGLKMDMQYFTDKRPSYYCFSNQTQEMTEAEIVAYFAKE